MYACMHSFCITSCDLFTLIWIHIVIFNDCRILCIELPDDGPYVTETCSVRKYIFVVSTVVWLIILYMYDDVRID
jgi:hypothetical protein